MFDGVDQVAGGLGVETDIRGVASEILALVVVTVTERKAAGELRRETFEQVAVLGGCGSCVRTRLLTIRNEASRSFTSTTLMSIGRSENDE
ncbi:MAG: hypothetical protein ACLVK4_01880 [Alistipes shahii]|uniref:hypothetical protein n=1 Tax=Alistipes shahii TaxID=328814 RepID=UPI00399D3846